ncbi:MAG: class I adenylate-forming enzyme family protein [Haloarculaceae archaeon]
MEHHDGGPLRHVGDLPAMGAHRYGEKTAFTFREESLSYAALDERASRLAAVLRERGVDDGDRVGIFVPNTTLFPQAHFGAIRAGAVSVPLNLRMDPETLAYVVGDADIDHLVGSPLLADEVEGLADAAGVGTLLVPGGPGAAEDLDAAMADAPLLDRVERDYDDVACQPYTSGTTGKPKGVLLSHRNLLSCVEALSGAVGVDPDDSMVLVLPFFHIYALNGIMGSYLYAGATLHLSIEPDPVPLLEAITERRPTKFAGVPAMFTGMYRAYREDPDAYDLSSLQDAICGAAPLAEDTRKRIEQTWNVVLYEAWGMTETSPAGAAEPIYGVRKAAGSVGPPLPGIRIKLVDPDTGETVVPAETIAPPGPPEEFDADDATGEIAIKGDVVFQGYHNRPERTERAFDDDGWFLTRDIARVDADGYLWIVDRADDMFIAGGENIYPTEVEDALYAHPDVAEAAVVPAPHEIKGQAPVAFVVPEAGSDPSEREIREFSLDHVATYAHPRRVFFVDELPRSATQKVQRFKLEDRVEALLDDPLESSERL